MIDLTEINDFKIMDFQLYHGIPYQSSLYVSMGCLGNSFTLHEREQLLFYIEDNQQPM